MLAAKSVTLMPLSAWRSSIAAYQPSQVLAPRRALTQGVSSHAANMPAAIAASMERQPSARTLTVDRALTLTQGAVAGTEFTLIQQLDNREH